MAKLGIPELSGSAVHLMRGRGPRRDRCQTSLSAFAQKLLSDNQDVYLEIEGHADSRGDPASNNAHGMKRAVATRDFVAQQGIPLHRMSVVSYGEIKPAASNDTAEGQAANRRASIVVVAP